MAKMKSKEIQEIVENIVGSPLDELMGNCYSIYAKDVITNRAIPDVRDGLKPVQRRIIFSMYKNNMFFSKPTKKCARIVGDVIGKYHPHGDSSIYEALARMSQDWKINMPLVDFQGNNGSIDGDGPAAYRYTEARLSLLAEELVKDIEKDTVEMRLNFDDTELEPEVLPCYFPNLYVNGGGGIAVALATEIPPHNLVEIDDAIIYKINHKDATVEDLLTFVKGPDFPTGGCVYDTEGLKSIYLTGKGKIDILSKIELVENAKENQILITEIPYQINKKDLVTEIEKVRQSKEIDGIIEVRDETEMHGARIVVDVKKESDCKLILQYLLNKTPLKSSYSANIVAICAGRPKTLDLLSYVNYYIDYQKEVITKRSNFILEKDKARLHIVDGLYKATLIVEEVVKTIKESDNKADAKVKLQKNYGFSEIQSDAIVNLQLYKLTHSDVSLFVDEKNALEKEIAELEEILGSEKKLCNVIVGNLKEISKKYGIKRRTEIIPEEHSQEVVINPRDLIINEEVMVAITRDGYIKRSSMKSYKSSNSILPGIKTKDRLVFADSASTLDYVLCFTSKGNYLFVPVNEIYDSKWKDEGKHINYLINLPFDEQIIRAVVISDFEIPAFVVSVTKKGQIKRTSLKEFFAIRYSKPICMMKMLKNDELVDAQISSGDSNIVLVNTLGNATYFNENQLNVLGNKTAGVKSMNNLKDSTVAGMLLYDPEEKGKFIVFTNKGHVRPFEVTSLALTQRLGKTTEIFKSFKSDIHKTVFIDKIAKGVDSQEYTFLDESSVIHEFVIDNFYIVPTKNAKDNLMINGEYLLKEAYLLNGQHINSNTVTYDVKIEEESIEEDETSNEEKKNYTQLNIFEDLGD